jgi:hypothetical protein
MNSNVTLLTSDEGGVVEQNLVKIVEFMGGTVQTVTLTFDGTEGREMLNELIPVGGCVIAHAGVLDAQSLLILRRTKARVLVYGFDPTQRAGELLKALTDDCLIGVEQGDFGEKIRVARCRDICGQMSNLVFDARGPSIRFVFKPSLKQGDWTALLSIGRSPFFVSVRDDDRQWMLLAGNEIADLDAAVHPGTSIMESFAGIAPIIMFLRAATPEAFWHNDTPYACFIVDDPLLIRRYGFLVFQNLIELIDQRRFSTSIAFIPWNYLRSQRRVTQMFVIRPGTCSLSVHGCDHTRAEFGTTDSLVLRQKARLALERMTKHRELTGVDFDNVMVFPQGIFSKVAMAALKSAGYLAAINSTPYPIDLEEPLQLRDLLGAAVTRFSDFPLLTRRYPRHLAELAFDIFLGKPALLVEHHGFFQEGYDALADTVVKLQHIEPRLRWTNPAAICSRTCWKRTNNLGHVQVSFFSDRFVLRNESSYRQRYVFIPQRLADADIAAVNIDGRPLDISRQDENPIEAGISLDAGELAEIQLETGAPEQVTHSSPLYPTYQFGVFVRRRLSEFRDNYLDRSPFLSNSAVAVKQLFGNRKSATQSVARR